VPDEYFPSRGSIAYDARTECIHTGGLVLRGANEWNRVNIYGTLGARDVGSRGRMHASIARFVTRLRRDYNSVDDRGRSWRLKFERKRRERPPIVEDMTNHREGRCNSDTIVTDMLTRRFLFALYDSHLQRLISWKFLFVVSEKLIEKFIS